MKANFKTRQIGKRLWQWVGTVAITVVFSGSAMAAGITSTKHNLTSTGAGPNKQSTTDQICVFCHTPHGADTSAVVPLWNKKMNVTGATYQTYDQLNTSTLNGQILAVGSVSLACLSCHDGTQAMDNIINAPGSGGYNATGGGAAGIGMTWNAGAKTMSNTATTLAMLGTDLRNDHPIGIQYCGGGQTSAAPTGACTDADFKGPGAGLQSATINGSLVWWVDSTSGTVGSRDKTDMILYSRAFTGGTGPSVECASCHDPHTEANPTFLRVSNVGSGVCLSCHVK